MAHLFETIMLICFGLSWPFNIYKSLHTRTARGKSLQFELCLVVGYLFGLAGKFVSGDVTYVVAVYLLDLGMVCTDITLTCRNMKLDRLAEKKEAAA